MSRVLGLVLALGLCASCSSAGSTSPSTGSSASASTPDPELFAVRMKSCMEDAGFAVDLTDDGGIKVDWAPKGTPTEEIPRLQKAVNDANAKCMHTYGYDNPPKVDPKTAWQQMSVVDECLREHGIDVSTPTFDEYQRGIYSHWPDEAAIGQARYKALKSACHF